MTSIVEIRNPKVKGRGDLLQRVSLLARRWRGYANAKLSHGHPITQKETI